MSNWYRTEETTYGTAIFRNGRKVATVRQRPDGTHAATFRGANVEGATVGDVVARILTALGI